MLQAILTALKLGKFVFDRFFSDKAQLRRAKKELKSKVKQDVKITGKRLKEIRKGLKDAQKTNNKSDYLTLTRERERLFQDFQKRNR